MTAPPVLLLMTALLIGRLTGLLRELLLGNLFGASHQVDLAIVAFSIPDALANFFLVSGFNAVLVPHLLAFPEHERATRFWAISLPILLCSILAAVFLAIFTTETISLFGPGLFPLSSTELQGFRWVLLSLPLAILSGLFVAWLASYNSFVFGGLGTAVVNVTIIAGILMGYASSRLFFWAVISLIVGMALRLFMHWVASSRYRLKPQHFEISRDLGLARKIFLAAISLAALTLAPLIFRSIASLFGEGSITLLSLSLKLIEVPLTVIFWSLGLVSLPKLSALYQQSVGSATEHLLHGLRAAVWLGIGCFVILAGLSDFWVYLLFGWGAFTAAELEVISKSISLGAIAFPLMGIATILLNDQFARNRYLDVFTCLFVTLLIAFLVAWYIVDHYELPMLMCVWGGLYCLIAVFTIIVRRRSGLPRLRFTRLDVGLVGLYPILVWLVITNQLVASLGLIMTHSFYVGFAGLMALIGFRSIKRMASTVV